MKPTKDQLAKLREHAVWGIEAGPWCHDEALRVLLEDYRARGEALRKIVAMEPRFVTMSPEAYEREVDRVALRALAGSGDDQ